MNGERAKLIIKLILGIAAIAVCCLFIIFVMRACSAGDDDPDAQKPMLPSFASSDEIWISDSGINFIHLFVS